MCKTCDQIKALTQESADKLKQCCPEFFRSLAEVLDSKSQFEECSSINLTDQVKILQTELEAAHDCIRRISPESKYIFTLRSRDGCVVNPV
jgi:hypothetical protein